MTTDPHAPAFPSPLTTETPRSSTGILWKPMRSAAEAAPAFSVRDYIATRAMERLLARTAVSWRPSSLAKCSVSIADALIAELNKPTQEAG